MSAPGAVRAVAAFAVDALFLNMLTTSKYQRVRPVGRRLGRAASLHLERSPHLAEVAGCRLVPVPLTRGKLRERGFNQPEDFARDLAGRIGAEVRVDLLVRVQSGKASAGRARSERAAAVRGAFAAPEAAVPVPRGSVKVRHAPLWIVDDVITTGSTAVACACALRASGVKVAGILAMGRAFESGDTVPQPSDLLTRL